MRVNNKIKKFLALILVLSLNLSLSACFFNDRTNKTLSEALNNSESNGSYFDNGNSEQKSEDKKAVKAEATDSKESQKPDAAEQKATNGQTESLKNSSDSNSINTSKISYSEKQDAKNSNDSNSDKISSTSRAKSNDENSETINKKPENPTQENTIKSSTNRQKAQVSSTTKASSTSSTVSNSKSTSTTLTQNTSSTGTNETNNANAEIRVALNISLEALIKNPHALPEHQQKLLVPNTGFLAENEILKVKANSTVLDVLKSFLDTKGIHYDIKNSAYVSGINNIYEFDAGPNSGWLYRVNGKLADRGAGSYNLRNGDIILWEYTVDYKA